MKMCQPHWEALRSEIRIRGMEHLVAAGGKAAAANMAAEVEGTATAANFDPLMSAYWAVVGQVMRIGGLAIMAPNEDGSERCPLCFANAEHKLGCQDPSPMTHGLPKRQMTRWLPRRKWG